jgi:hypothetical protein
MGQTSGSPVEAAADPVELGIVKVMSRARRRTLFTDSARLAKRLNEATRAIPLQPRSIVKMPDAVHNEHLKLRSALWNR